MSEFSEYPKAIYNPANSAVYAVVADLDEEEAQFELWGVEVGAPKVPLGKRSKTPIDTDEE